MTRKHCKMLYYHDPEDLNDRTLYIILAVIVGVVWAIVHFLDWMMLDMLPWWSEPLFIIPGGLLLIVFSTYGKNPFYWWPMFCGTKIAIPDEVWFHLNYDPDKLITKYGGLFNVHIDQDYIKFRRKRDAVSFCLLHL